MSTDVEHDQTDSDHQRADERIDQACHHLLEMFAAVCAAPDDSTVAAQANAALRELEGLLTAV
jgi:hypothetical protein